MEISKSNKTALLFGATGLVGGYALNFLLHHPAYQKVVVFTRRPLKIAHSELVPKTREAGGETSKLVQHLIDFDRPDSFRHLVKGDDLFLCLGTTMAKAGSKAAFFKVDFTYSQQAAKIAADNGVHQLLLVSSIGANPDSMFFYSKVKGQLEEAVQQLKFWSIHIFRPSVLLGERNENRFGEAIAGKIGKVIDRLTGGLLTKYRPIEADVVANAMVIAAQGLTPGVHFYPSHWLSRTAHQNAHLKTQ